MNETQYNPRGLDYVAGGNFIAVNRSLLRAVGINAAVLLGELADKARHLQSHGELDDGWFYMGVEDVERNTTLGEKAQRSAIGQLRELGFVETKYRGTPRKRYFRINCTAIIQAIAEIDELETDDGGAQCSIR